MTNNESNHSTQNFSAHFPAALREVYKDCQELSGQSGGQQEIHLSKFGINFLGICLEWEDKTDVSQIRRTIGRMLNLEEYRIVQVVGDSSNGYKPAVCEEVKVIITDALQDASVSTKTSILEYGYTASENDINNVVNEVVASVAGLGARTIGNVVYKSASVVEGGNYEANDLVQNILLTYSKGYTDFGDDVWVSDHIMSSSTSDLMICVEGGPQAFVQAVNVLLRGVTVLAVTGSGSRVSKLQTADPKFSAAFLLARLRDLASDHVDETNAIGKKGDNMRKVAIDYLEKIFNTETYGSNSRCDMLRASCDRLLDHPTVLPAIHVRYLRSCKNE